LATAAQIKLLADEYRGAAHDLLIRGRKGQPSSWAPARMTAIHAIELYLNALPLAKGHTAAEIRGLQHDLAKRAELAAVKDLGLRRRTLQHLGSLSEGREYLVTRYGPEFGGSWTQLNRLLATLDEVRAKVAAAVEPGTVALLPARARSAQRRLTDGQGPAPGPD
jgi:hypothetical protein